MTAREPQPNLKLSRPEKPFQKIILGRIPASLYRELHKRASKYSKKPHLYCRMVLEHAMQHKSDYAGPIKKEYDGSLYDRSVTVPVANKQFLQDLLDWDPYGVGTKRDVAISILKKHLDVRSW